MNVLQLGYLSRLPSWQTCGLFPLRGYYEQSSRIQDFLWTFLLDIYLHVKLLAQKVRHMCNFGRNGHMALGKAAPSASPQQLSWSARMPQLGAGFFLQSVSVAGDARPVG